MKPPSSATATKVLQTAGAYSAAALAFWGAMDVAIDAFSLEGAVLRAALIASIAGLPIALLVSWMIGARQAKEPALAEEHEHTAQWAGVLGGGGVAGVVFAGLLVFAEPPEQIGSTTNVPNPIKAAIAVLPFENLSEDGTNQHMVDGIADDVVTSLQSWGSFPVIPRLATKQHVDAESDIQTTAAALGVRYVLIGSVRAIGEKLRITAQLVDGRTNRQLWAQNYDRNSTEIFAVQDEITEEIVTAIAPEISRNESRRAGVERPADLATWELVIRAKALIIEGSYEATLEAEKMLNLAIEREPGYALSYVRYAESEHNVATSYANVVGQDAAATALERSLDHARHAVRLNPYLVEARFWLGHVLLHDRQIKAGVEQLREAVNLNPSHAQAHSELGFGFAMQGDFDKAFVHLDDASRLSPNDPNSNRILTARAFAYLYSGKNEDAISIARSIIEPNQGSALNIWAQIIEISALVRQGRMDAAAVRASEYKEVMGEMDWPAVARAAWSQEQLDLVHSDMITVGLLATE